MDDLTERLRQLKSDWPEPRALDETQKDQLIEHMGYHTVNNIIKAKKDFALKRIPFLFSSLDSQNVIDVLHNDFHEAMKRAKKTSPSP